MSESELFGSRVFRPDERLSGLPFFLCCAAPSGRSGSRAMPVSSGCKIVAGKSGSIDRASAQAEAGWTAGPGTLSEMFMYPDTNVQNLFSGEGGDCRRSRLARL